MDAVLGIAVGVSIGMVILYLYRKLSAWWTNYKYADKIIKYFMYVRGYSEQLENMIDAYNRIRIPNNMDGSYLLAQLPDIPFRVSIEYDGNNAVGDITIEGMSREYAGFLISIPRGEDRLVGSVRRTIMYPLMNNAKQLGNIFISRGAAMLVDADNNSDERIV